MKGSMESGWVWSWKNEDGVRESLAWKWDGISCRIWVVDESRAGTGVRVLV